MLQAIATSDALPKVQLDAIPHANTNLSTAPPKIEGRDLEAAKIAPFKKTVQVYRVDPELELDPALSLSDASLSLLESQLTSKERYLRFAKCSLLYGRMVALGLKPLPTSLNGDGIDPKSHIRAVNLSASAPEPTGVALAPEQEGAFISHAACPSLHREEQNLALEELSSKERYLRFTKSRTCYGRMVAVGLSTQISSALEVPAQSA